MEQLRQLVVALVGREEVGCSSGGGTVGTKEMGVKVKVAKATGVKEKGRKAMGVREMGGKVKGTKASGMNVTGVQDSQRQDGKATC